MVFFKQKDPIVTVKKIDEVFDRPPIMLVQLAHSSWPCGRGL